VIVNRRGKIVVAVAGGDFDGFTPLPESKIENPKSKIFSAVAVVEALDAAGRRCRGRSAGRGGSGGSDAEAVTEEELFVFPVEMEDLQEFFAGFGDDLGASGVGARCRGGGRGGVAAFEGGQAFIEAGEEGALFFEQGAVGDALVLF
jgi:hypothetical protein